MEEKKYYTPTIEEIIYQLTNVGEVYGVNKKGELLKFQTHPDIVNTLHKFIEMNDFMADKDGFKYSINPILYKIKYLDREDIESLGFKITKEYEFEIEAQYLENDFKFWDITYDLEDKILTVEEFSQSKMIAATSWKERSNLYSSYVTFHGSVKNKSELIKVLKQIGFYGDKL